MPKLKDIHTLLIGGGTGFVGHHLINHVKQRFPQLSIHVASHGTHKGTPSAPIDKFWNYDQLREEKPMHFDAAINLAGLNVMSSWKKHKKEIFDSRIHTTQIIAPLAQTFVGTSAVGYYPVGSSKVFDETDTEYAKNNLGELCHQIETCLQEEPKQRRAFLRPGMVMGADGGAFPGMAMGFKLSPIGDLCRLYVWALENDSMEGPVNAVAPECDETTALSFAQEMQAAAGNRIARPWAVPESLLRTLLGEEGATVLCEGTRVVPRKALNSGFTFEFGSSKEAIRDLYPKVTLSSALKSM